MLTINSTVPSILLSNESFDNLDTVANNCSSLYAAGYVVQNCDNVSFSISTNNTLLLPSISDVVLINPLPANCPQNETVQFYVAHHPVITSVDKPVICLDDAAQSITFFGTGFLRIDGVFPLVSMNGVPLQVLGDNNCTSINLQVIFLPFLIS